MSSSVPSLKGEVDLVPYFVRMQLFDHLPLLAQEMGNAGNASFPQDSPSAHTSSPSPLLTQTVVSVMCQVESIIARASVIARDVDTVVHTTCIIFSFALIHVCGQRGSEAAGPTPCPPLSTPGLSPVVV